MLNSTKHEIFPAHKCKNANNCWQFNIYERKNSILDLSEPEKAELLDVFILRAVPAKFTTPGGGEGGRHFKEILMGVGCP